MGRYSMELARPFADQAGVRAPMMALDVGCGTGALTAEFVRRLGAESVSACDPSLPFVENFSIRFPDVTVKHGAAEALPFADDSFDVALAQLVFHFVTDPEKSLGEMMRVTKRGGVVGACVWDMTGGMGLFKAISAAANEVEPNRSPFHARLFGTPGEIKAVFERAGLQSISEELLTIQAPYADFDDLWISLQSAAGPTADFFNSRSGDELLRLQDALFEHVGRPDGSFSISAAAWSVVGVTP